jgi:hypothetical protein
MVLFTSIIFNKVHCQVTSCIVYFKADIKLEGRDIHFNMSEEEIESGIEGPLDPVLENIARYR